MLSSLRLIVGVLCNDNGYRILRSHVTKVYREVRKGSNPSCFIKCVGLSMLLSDARHMDLQKKAKKLIKDGHHVGWYYLAHSQFVCGGYLVAKASLSEFLFEYPNHPDATYLMAEILCKLNDKESAWTVLANLLDHSKRLKTWLYLANLVDSKYDFERFEQYRLKMGLTGSLVSRNRSLAQYFSLGALRAKEFEVARDMWRNIYLEHRAVGFPWKGKNIVSLFSEQFAARALKDLKQTLDCIDIPFFLVSGTLLGCMREGRILGHDKDIDVGIWDNSPRDKLEHALNTSGLFYISTSRSTGTIRVKHVNGIAIDVFIHYQAPDNYWHSGVKLQWNNKPFELIPCSFLGEVYLIPETYQVYLTENYGDWKTPKYEFDCAIDTPNAEIINETEMIVHAYQRLVSCNSNSQPYLNLLTQLGEGFVLKHDGK